MTVLQPHLAQGPHGGQVSEAVGLETLYPAALMVDTDQQVSAQLFDAAAQCAQLRPVLPVARKQDQAAHQWVLQALPVELAQAGALNVNDQGGMLGHGAVLLYLIIFYSDSTIFGGA